MADAILAQSGAAAFRSHLIAEGGGISVDGEGTILTTLSRFPNRNRNPGWSRDQIADELMQMLGGQKVIRLPGNHAETETDGHVDGIAVFAAPGIVIVQALGPQDHPWDEIHAANLAAIEGQRDAQGRALTLIQLPDASDAQPATGPEICVSYVNFYLCNDAVIASKYGLREDAQVFEILQDAFPGRAVVMVAIDQIATGGGGIHCITQQEPRVLRL